MNAAPAQLARLQASRRRMQIALVVAKCVQIAVEYGEDETLDLADAVAGLVFLPGHAIASLAPPEDVA